MSIVWTCLEVVGEMLATILLIALVIFALWWAAK